MDAKLLPVIQGDKTVRSISHILWHICLMTSRVKLLGHEVPAFVHSQHDSKGHSSPICFFDSSCQQLWSADSVPGPVLGARMMVSLLLCHLHSSCRKARTSDGEEC